MPAMSVTPPAPPTPAGDEFALHAWVDESMVIPRQGPGTYLLAAAFADPTLCAGVRETMAGLRAPGQTKLHWRDEDDSRRRKIVTAVADCDVASVVVIGMPLAKSKQERGRALCMERLLYELDALGVDRVYLESRTKSLNARDMSTVVRLRGVNAISSLLRVDVLEPSGEPMLWIPDIVVGAVKAARSGQDEYLSRIESCVEQIEIDFR
jgi:hypothetical protein